MYFRQSDPLLSLSLFLFIIDSLNTDTKAPHPSHTLSPAQKRCLPYLCIPGVTPPPQRFYVEGKGRRSLKLAVFVNLIGGVFIKELSGTKYEGEDLKQRYKKGKHKTQQGQPAKAMTKKEFAFCVRAAHNHFNNKPAFARLDKIFLVQDGARVHGKKALHDAPWEPVTQPPHSPDMMPLDYGIFGFTKIKLQRAVDRGDSWEAKVQMFKKFLMEASVGPTIEEFPLRMDACISSKGMHIEKKALGA